MPRLDPYWLVVRVEFDITGYNENDPGATDPVDVCTSCFAASFPPSVTCDHPPYSECDYVCRMCGEPLTDEDNEP